jgi:hypothetical protein
VANDHLAGAAIWSPFLLAGWGIVLERRRGCGGAVGAAACWDDAAAGCGRALPDAVMLRWGMRWGCGGLVPSADGLRQGCGRALACDDVLWSAVMGFGGLQQTLAWKFGVLWCRVSRSQWPGL